MKRPDRRFNRLKRLYVIRKRSNYFLASQWSGGVTLVLFALIALVLGNMECTKHVYHHILETEAGFGIGNFRFSLTIEQWINDALMAVFFFVVGLEIKREIVAGELSSRKKASLPVAAALGGMIAPALIYFSINSGTEFEPGWGVPMATDIAFAIGVLSLLGNRVPITLKIFLTALAIVDDLGAILVIAIFYSSGIDFLMLGAGITVVVILYLFNKRGITATGAYLIPGLFVWYAFLNSGVHATIAGVLVAMMMPTSPRFSKKYFSYKVRHFLEEFKHKDREGEEVLSNPDQLHALDKVYYISHGAVCPVQRLEHKLSPFVAFLIMPVFALANAGVDFANASVSGVFQTTQGMGIFLGLLIGKPLGIGLFCWLAIKFGIGAMPDRGTWPTLMGVACLGGIGFTMSIFINNLAFSGTPYIDSGKIAVLVASVTASILGSLIINVLAKRPISKKPNVPV